MFVNKYKSVELDAGLWLNESIHVEGDAMQYRRAKTPGGSYFFTVVTHERHPWLADPDVARTLGEVMRRVRGERPFETLAMVLMPDHLHCIWRLPSDDADLSTRWLLIKQFMTHRLSGRMPIESKACPVPGEPFSMHLHAPCLACK